MNSPAGSSSGVAIARADHQPACLAASRRTDWRPLIPHHPGKCCASSMNCMSRYDRVMVTHEDDVAARGWANCPLPRWGLPRLVGGGGGPPGKIFFGRGGRACRARRRRRQPAWACRACSSALQSLGPLQALQAVGPSAKRWRRLLRRGSGPDQFARIHSHRTSVLGLAQLESADAGLCSDRCCPTRAKSPCPAPPIPLL